MAEQLVRIKSVEFVAAVALESAEQRVGIGWRQKERKVRERKEMKGFMAKLFKFLTLFFFFSKREVFLGFVLLRRWLLWWECTGVRKCGMWVMVFVDS